MKKLAKPIKAEYMVEIPLTDEQDAMLEPIYEKAFQEAEKNGLAKGGAGMIIAQIFGGRMHVIHLNTVRSNALLASLHAADAAEDES